MYTESALLGVSILMPSPISSSPQGYLQEIKEKHRFGNGNKPQTNNHLEHRHRKTSWQGKKQLHSVRLSCFQSRKQWGRTAIISPPDGKQHGVKLLARRRRIFFAHMHRHRHTGRQTPQKAHGEPLPATRVRQTDREHDAGATVRTHSSEYKKCRLPTLSM